MKRALPARRASSVHAARARATPEDIEQAALIRWARLAVNTYPDLARLHHIPNGGHRHPAVAAQLQAQGVRPGVPDLCLPTPRGRYHGLYIEMKSLTGRPSAEQSDWIAYLISQGYAAVVCHGWDAARAVLIDYLEGRYEG